MGQEIYKSLISNFYRNSSLAIILYSIDNKESFEHTENWLTDLKSQANPDVRIFLVGNKSDLEEERKVTKEEGLKFKNIFIISIIINNIIITTIFVNTIIITIIIIIIIIIKIIVNIIIYIIIIIIWMSKD